jgi:hypothetical protein
MINPPDLVVYTRPGCGLCRDALEAIETLVAVRRADGRPVPNVVERDISSDPALERAYFDRIPVVDLGGRRLELVTGAARLRRLLADALDSPHQAEGEQQADDPQQPSEAPVVGG